MSLGRLGDRVGHGRVVVWCAAVTAVGAVPQAFVTGVWQLLWLQALTGASVGGLIPSLSALLARNPRLIHVCVTSFGHTGPRAGLPGYDILSQGMSGIMSLTGTPDGEPMRYPAPISDMTVGLYALIGILAALYERERTGRGQAIDAAILESQMGWLTNLAGSYFATGANPPRMGIEHAVHEAHGVLLAEGARQFDVACPITIRMATWTKPTSLAIPS